MTRDPIDRHGAGPDLDAPRGGDSAGVRTRITVLTWGSASVLAVIAMGAAYLAGSSRTEQARSFSLREGAGLPRAVAFGTQGELLAAMLIDDGIRIWRIDRGMRRAVPWGPAQPGGAAAFMPSGATLAVGGDFTLTLRETSEDEPRLTVRTDAVHTQALAFGRDGTALAVAGEQFVEVRDTATGRVRAGPFSVPGSLTCVALAPDDQILATGSFDGRVQLWDLHTGRSRSLLRAHLYNVTSLAFSDDGRILATASNWDKVCRLWNAATGGALRALRGHTGTIQALAIAPGGSLLATTAYDGTVRLWDVAMGRERATLRAPGLGASALAFSPDGHALAAVGAEVEGCVWDVSGILGQTPPKGVPP